MFSNVTSDWDTNMLYEVSITFVKGAVGFTTIYVIIAHHHWSCEFESHSGANYSIQHLCDKVCQWLATGRWFSPGTPVSSTNKTDRHDITEILLKVALNK